MWGRVADLGASKAKMQTMVLVLTAAVVSAASATLDYLPWINLCAEANCGGKVYAGVAEFNNCTLIPDSNATGDNGSRITVSPGQIAAPLQEMATTDMIGIDGCARERRLVLCHVL